MKINAAQLEAFGAAARLRNFTKAAASLHITQSALSQRIAKLEEDLEVTLFIRGHGSVRLTESGRHVQRFCQLNESSESDLLGRLKDSGEGLSGVVRIGGFSSVNRSLLIPAVGKLMRDHPRLSVQIMTRELRELPTLLGSGEADYVLTTRKSESTDLENVFLGYEANVRVASRRFGGGDVFLDHDEYDPTTRAYFGQSLAKSRPRTLRYLDDVYGLLDGVKNGLGQAILPTHLIEGDRELKVIEPKRRLMVPVFLNFYRQPFYRKCHPFFVDAVTSYFRARLPANAD